MKILITGKNGFVGSSLCEYFSNNNSVQIEAIGHSELDLLDEKQVDIFFEGKYYDAVINAAVWSPPKNSPHSREIETEADLRMHLHLAKHSDKFGKLIMFGSGAEYNKEYDIISVTETDKLEYLPKTHYGFAKYVADMLIRNSRNIYNLRIFALYGKNENYRVKFITGACAKAVLDLPISIRQNVYFDYLYINDFCKMVERFIQLEKPKYHTYNITSGTKVDLISLAEMISEVSGKTIKIIVCREGLAKEYTADNKRLLNEIGDIGFTSHRDAIRDLYQYYSDHKDELDIMSLVYQ